MIRQADKLIAITLRYIAVTFINLLKLSGRWSVQLNQLPVDDHAYTGITLNKEKYPE